MLQFKFNIGARRDRAEAPHPDGHKQRETQNAGPLGRRLAVVARVRVEEVPDERGYLVARVAEEEGEDGGDDELDDAEAASFEVLGLEGRLEPAEGGGRVAARARSETAGTRRPRSATAAALSRPAGGAARSCSSSRRASATARVALSFSVAMFAQKAMPSSSFARRSLSCATMASALGTSDSSASATGSSGSSRRSNGPAVSKGGSSTRAPGACFMDSSGGASTSSIARRGAPTSRAADGRRARSAAVRIGAEGQPSRPLLKASSPCFS